MLLEGVFPPITTPFYPNGDLYLRKLEHNVARYSRTQLAGMVVLGSTGEAVMLSPEEQHEVLDVAISTAASDKVMIAGVGQESVRHTIAMAEHAAALRYDAVMVRTPSFYRGQFHRADDSAQLEMLTYFRVVADKSPLPVVLYSIPALTLYDLPVNVITELAQHPNIIGIKDSSGKPERIAAIVAATQAVKRTVTVTPVFAAVTQRMITTQPENLRGKFVAADALGETGAAVATAAPVAMKTRQKEIGFSVLTGGASTMHDALNAGASGAILAFATCAPQCCYEVWAAWKEGDTALTAEKQDRIGHASIRVGAEMGIPGLKFACELNGYYGGRPRLPLLPLTAVEQREVASLMADIRY